MKQKSRATRLSEALGEMGCGTIETAQTEVQELRDELQNWLDNIPDNLQSGTKASELEDAISELEDLDSTLQDIIDNIQDAANTDITFPGMY